MKCFPCVVFAHLIFCRKIFIREFLKESVNKNPCLSQVRSEPGKGAFDIGIEHPLNLVGRCPGVRELMEEIRFRHLP
jgi:hypothetical protein